MNILERLIGENQSQHLKPSFFEKRLFVLFKRALVNIDETKNELNSLKEEIVSLKQERRNYQSGSESSSSCTALPNDLDNSIKEILIKVSMIQDINSTIENIDYNIRNQSNSSYSKDYVESLHRQINDYKEDVYIKLLKRYFINVYIGVYRYVALLRYNALNNNASFINAEIEGVIKEIEDGLAHVGIDAFHTNTGGDFNIKEMTLSDKFPRIHTTNENERGKVAFSVYPKFSVRISEDSDCLVLNKEEVALFEDILDNNQQM